MQVYLQRLCWNTHLWRSPSGAVPVGEDSYAGRYGFGHEEWNFNTNDVIDGHVYGYIYHQPPDDRLPGPVDIYFYALTPSKQRVLVGVYKEARYLNSAERGHLKQRMEDLGILDRRAEEIEAFGRTIFADSQKKARELLRREFAWNLRVLPEHVHVYRPHEILERVGPRQAKHLNRYSRATHLELPPHGAPESEDVGNHGGAALAAAPYVRENAAREIIVERRHTQLAERFCAWLGSAGATSIQVEQRSVDLQCGYAGERWMFELKTCDTRPPRHALREAVGQVLEYNFFPGRNPYSHSGIVIDIPPSQSEIDWIRRLREQGFSMEVFWLKGEQVYSARLGKSGLSERAATRPSER